MKRIEGIFRVELKVPIHQGDGTADEACLFVAAPGFSNKTYVEAFADERLEHWISGHCHALAYLGRVPRAVVPNNPKTAVIRPCRYEPVLHRSYQEMAAHYGTVILPDRVRKPRDKAKVETGGQIVERQILATLRDQRFFNVSEFNESIRPRLDKLNAQPFQKLDGSRDSWFETQEKAVLLPLPAQPFELATWGKARVNIDYHVVVDYHGYRVPYHLVHQELETRSTAITVEFFHQGKRVAAHLRSYAPGNFTTLEEHRPKSHQRYPCPHITGVDCLKTLDASIECCSVTLSWFIAHQCGLSRTPRNPPLKVAASHLPILGWF